MHRHPIRPAALGGVVVLALAAITLIAGPLDPPAGPITPTYKTLTEVEPRIAVNATNTPGDADSLYKLNQPGSYYLTGNITGVAGKHGIEIGASGVTLDLNGFALNGVVGSLDGVNISAFRGRGIAVRNGAVGDWGDCGVEAEYNGGHPPFVEIAGVHASENANDGIALSFSSMITGCMAHENGDDGIVSGASAVVSNCSATINGGDGIVAGSYTAITGCIASANAGTGFALATDSTMEDCVATTNNIGIAAQGSVIRGCVASDSVNQGMAVFEGCTIINTTTYRNGGNGVEVNGGTNIKDCTSFDNDGNGFSIGTSSTIQGCTARENGGNGIVATNSAIILQNECHTNGQGIVGGAGIAVDGTDNRVEGNNCSGQDRGIEVTASGNIIITNTCSGNTTNWDVVANNKCYVVLGVNAGAIVGNSGGVSPGSSNPFANFTY